MQILSSILIGLGLSAACGFRIFVPLLILSITGKLGLIKIGEGFLWIQSWPALIAFSVATISELIAYFIPWVDNLLDNIASPTAVIAGITITASMLGEMTPFLQWSVAIIGGGGVAAAVQAGSVVTRATASITTGGLANPIVALVEGIASASVSIFVLVIPLVGGTLVLAVLLYSLIKIFKHRRRRKKAALQSM